MRKALAPLLSLIVFILLLAPHGCADGVMVPDPPASEQPASASEGDVHLFEGRIREIAQIYKSYGRITNVLPGERRPPACLCHMGIWVIDVGCLFSDNGYGPTHGRRLYSLFVKDRQLGPYDESYTMEGKPSPVGQVVVEEAWVPDEAIKDGKPITSIERRVRLPDASQEERNDYLPYGWLEGRWYRATRKMGLHIMFKLDPKTPGTDAGWVYGTVSADGKTLGPVGRVATCMACHRDAPHDRLFGLREE
jgi:hypothetical protein